MPPIAVLVALADPTRCRIVEILRDGPQPVHILAASFKISRPAISRHLRVLKQAKLISEKKLGRENRYALHAEKLRPVGEWVAEMRAAKVEQPLVASKATANPKTPAAPPVKPKAKLEVAVAALPVKPISQMGFDF